MLAAPVRAAARPPARRVLVPAPQASDPATLATDLPQGRQAEAEQAVPLWAAARPPARQVLAPVQQALAQATLVADLPQGRHAEAVLAEPG